jgi:hypothetical protein
MHRLIDIATYRLMRRENTPCPGCSAITICNADCIIVMEQGRIVERGTHAQLLAMGGVYASHWKHQSSGFLADE